VLTTAELTVVARSACNKDYHSNILEFPA